MVEAQGKPFAPIITPVNQPAFRPNNQLFTSRPSPNFAKITHVSDLRTFKLVCSPEKAPNLDFPEHNSEMMQSYFVNLINNAIDLVDKKNFNQMFCVILI
jgi:hypothetical protein